MLLAGSFANVFRHFAHWAICLCICAEILMPGDTLGMCCPKSAQLFSWAWYWPICACDVLVTAVAFTGHTSMVLV